MKLRITRRAELDLDEIHQFIARDRPDSATRVVARILRSMDSLAAFPRMGHAGIVRGSLEHRIPGTPYIVAYSIDSREGVVAIIGVHHGAQDRG